MGGERRWRLLENRTESGFLSGKKGHTGFGFPDHRNSLLRDIGRKEFRGKSRNRAFPNAFVAEAFSHEQAADIRFSNRHRRLRHTLPGQVREKQKSPLGFLGFCHIQHTEQLVNRGLQERRPLPSTVRFRRNQKAEQNVERIGDKFFMEGGFRAGRRVLDVRRSRRRFREVFRFDGCACAMRGPS